MVATEPCAKWLAPMMHLIVLSGLLRYLSILVACVVLSDKPSVAWDRDVHSAYHRITMHLAI